jgi:Concanavalin A-like lectin/glucanases superfamily/FG-GAP-like repeat/IPT/TIG domain/FG-GAP repeat
MKKLFYLFMLLLNALALQAQKPNITNFSPTSGVVGTSVTITGTNFNATAAQNIVYFGATKATVTAASTTSLTVTVPVGATFQPISVLNLSTVLTGFSSVPFRVTYVGGSIVAESLGEDRVDFTAGTLSLFIATGDLDGDGKTDMVTANFNANTISILRNTATLGSITETSFAAKVDIATATNPRSVAIGDIDGDGKLDMAVANSGSNSVSVFRNTSTSGNITFAAKVDFATGLSPRSVNIGDFDGDGKPDLAIAHRDNNFMSVLRNTSSSGSISFQGKVDFFLAAGNISTFINSGDLDGDGKLDIAVTSYSGTNNHVSVFRNTATSGTIDANSFAARTDFTTGVFPFSLAIGDLDGDGKPDLAVANYSGDNSVSVLRNTSSSGSTSFATKVDFPVGVAPIAVNLGDIDGDAKLDLITSNYSTNKISIFRNIATSGSISANSFAAKVNYFNSTGPRFVAIGDLDGDGKPDLAVANETDNSVSVLQNSFISVPTNVTGPATICTNNTASLSATCVAGTSPTWWEASYIIISGDPLPPPLFVGSPFITPLLTFTTTYRVSCEQGANVSPRVPITVNVSSNPSPTAPTITASGATTFCNGGSVTLNSNVGNNNALNFVRTSSQYVSVPHSASINLGATFTMEVWVKYLGANSTIIDKGNYNFLWSLNANSNKMGFYTRNTGAWVYSTSIVPENTWTHVAITLSAGTLTFYINGVASGTASVTFSQDGLEMNIGRQQPSACVCNHFNGSMDELRLWNVVRTQAQIQGNWLQLPYWAQNYIA